MSIEHLKQLRQSLEKAKWLVHEELPGNDYDASGYWVVCRPNGKNMQTIVFEGLDDTQALPMEKSYGCHLQGSKALNLYFGNLKKSFPSELAEFVNRLPCENT